MLSANFDSIMTATAGVAFLVLGGLGLALYPVVASRLDQRREGSRFFYALTRPFVYGNSYNSRPMRLQNRLLCSVFILVGVALLLKLLFNG